MADKNEAKKPENGSSEEKKKRVRFSQADFPRFTIEKAMDIAKTIWDQFGGKSAEPHQIAIALNLSPASGHWRNLTGASIAYGLTEGGYGAKEIILTPLGRSIVGPTAEGEDIEARTKAVLQPAIMCAFFEKYDKAKLPSQVLGANVLQSMGLPKERSTEAFDLIVKNGYYTGLIMETKTGPFVCISVSNGESERKAQIAETKVTEPEHISQSDNSNLEMEQFAKQIAAVPDIQKPTVLPQKNNKVFISHGKNRQVVEQLKEIIRFGKYEPVICVENESLSKPVPDKVLDDMRSCFAGIINVHSEGEMLDPAGNSQIKINDNVLIEIGAAMALYGRNYILLVQKGIKLPSNLQGLYRCEYEGEKLDYEATMKLLKTFNQFS